MSLPKTLQKLINNSGYGQTLTGSDNDIVHKTGDEEINGFKKFLSPIRATTAIQIRNNNTRRGVLPSGPQYTSISFDDNNEEAQGNSGRFGLLENVINQNGEVQTYITAYKNSSSDETSMLIAGWDQNGVAYSVAPSTSVDRSYGCDILTRDWIPQDTRIVHTTGDETISGLKTFNNTVLFLDHSSRRSGALDVLMIKEFGDTVNDANFGIQFLSPTEELIGRIREHLYTDGNTYLAFDTRNMNDNRDETVCGLVIESGSTNKSPCYRPSVSNIVTIGNATYRYKEIFCSNATINTSDERLKSTITSIPDNVLDAWSNIEFVQYQFNDALQKKGSSARFHNGLIAQDINKVFNTANLDTSRYGLFCYDEWDATPEEVDDGGNVVCPALPAGDQYSIRYEEALCMEAAYQRRRADRAEARIANLEEEVSSLKSQFSQLLNSAAG